MHRLKGAHQGQRAIVVLGGPSLIERGVDFRALRRRGDALFLDAQSLTPRALEAGADPDYFLMLFPEKCKGHGLHHFIFRSFLAQFNVGPCIKRAYAHVWQDMAANRDQYLEPWRLYRGPHKRYRWKPGVHLEDSPRDLLPRIPRARIITERHRLDDQFPGFALTNPVHYCEQSPQRDGFDLDQYYAPIEQQERVLVRYNTFINSAAIALYPLLAFMGFREVYLVGMDMSMLGAMEYAAPYTFRSMLHFRWFFSRSCHVFNGNYKPNRPYYYRPRQEFEEARMLLTASPLRLVRVYEPGRYTAPLDGVPTISWQEFLRS